MPDKVVPEALDEAIGRHVHTRSNAVNHSTEFTWMALDEWAQRRGGLLDFIRRKRSLE